MPTAKTFLTLAEAPTRADAEKFMPFAGFILRTDNGWRAFETIQDAIFWDKQA